MIATVVLNQPLEEKIVQNHSVWVGNFWVRGRAGEESNMSYLLSTRLPPIIRFDVLLASHLVNLIFVNSILWPAFSEPRPVFIATFKIDDSIQQQQMFIIIKWQSLIVAIWVGACSGSY